jgi:hypothetical protein
MRASSAGTWSPAATPQRTPLAPSPDELAPRQARDPIRALVVGLDEWLRRRNDMLEYSDSPDCMLRVARRRAECGMTLSDGLVVVRGDPILDLHFWNERIPQTSATQGLGWGGRFGRQLIGSFCELAEAIERDPRICDAVAIRGRLAFAGARNRDEMRRFGHWFGLETPSDERRLPLGQRVHEAAEDIWLVFLSYAFNPGSLRGRQTVRRRDDLWMSKSALITRYRNKRKAAA